MSGATRVAYLALLRKTPDSDWGVEFPNVPGCISAGTTMEGALAAAREALQGHLDTLHALGDAVPEPRAVEESTLRRYEADEVLHTALVEIRPPARTVRINLTIQDRLLARLDELAKSKGTTRSGMVARLVESA